MSDQKKKDPRSKKLYWLKLDKNFFKRHDVAVIESLENGKDYLLFYMKLLLESLSHEGMLRFSDTIPYNNKMLATITNTNIDIVKSAVELFTSLHLMEIWDNQTIYMTELNKMIGVETRYAEIKRLERAEKKERETKELGQSPEKSHNISYSISKSISHSISNSNIKDTNIENIKEVIDYLNEQLGSSYRYTTKKTQDLIKARMNEGFELNDFKTVIFKKVKEWKGSEWEKYLRPETLFSNKFESYLQQPIKVDKTTQGMGGLMRLLEEENENEVIIDVE